MSTSFAEINELSDAELLMQFESLGDNCEFGLVQRYCGAEPLGLFRLSFAHMSDLLASLNKRFEDVGLSNDIELFRRNHDLMVRIKSYRFEYHTVEIPEKSETDLLSMEEKKIRYLSGKLCDDLEDGEKIFVRKGEGSFTLKDAVALSDALQAFGNNTLLWVVEADAQHEPGEVEIVNGTIIKGYIDRFAPYTDAHNISLGRWVDICRKAYVIKRLGASCLKQLRPKQADNTIEFADTFGFWSGSEISSNFLVTSIAPPISGGSVMKHVLWEENVGRPENVYIFGYRAPRNESKPIYTFSCFILIPEEFDGNHIYLDFNGISSLSSSRINMTRKGKWQRVWVSAKVGSEITSFNPALALVGNPPSYVYSSCWKVEAGGFPTDYIPLVAE